MQFVFQIFKKLVNTLLLPFRWFISLSTFKKLKDTVPKSVSELQRQSSQQLNLKFTKTYKLNKKR